MVRIKSTEAAMAHAQSFRSAVLRLTDYEPGRSVQAVARDFGIPLHDIVKLSSNENTFGPSPAALAAISSEYANLYMYPWEEFTDLKEAVALANGVKAANVVLSSGSEQLVQVLPQLYVNPGDEVIVAPQTYERYEEACLLMDAVVRHVPLRDYRHDVEAIAAAVTVKTKIIWICNPNNPTATILTAEELGFLLEAVPVSVAVVLDQAYYEFVEDPAYANGLDFLKDGHPNVITLRTFSKAYALAGLRLGFALADPVVCQMLDRIHEPFFLNRAATAAGPAALGDRTWLEACRRSVDEGRRLLTRELEAIGLSVVPSQANFILVDVAMDARNLFERMMAVGVIVRPADGWGYPHHIRITVGKPDENRRLIEVLHMMLG